MFISDIYLDAVIKGGVLTTLILLWIIFLVRVVGLRSFSKMTSIDFIMTIAVGSITAGAAQSSEWNGFFQSVTAIAALFAIQYTIAKLRHRWTKFSRLLQNTPKLLMKDGVILDDVLQKTRVTKSDLIAKLREAGVTDLSQVRAVVLETTGDVSVIQGPTMDDRLLSDLT